MCTLNRQIHDLSTGRRHIYQPDFNITHIFEKISRMNRDHKRDGCSFPKWLQVTLIGDKGAGKTNTKDNFKRIIRQ